MDGSRRRRVAIVAIASIVASTCIGLGVWQLQRLTDRRARNAAIERERSQAPVPITTGTQPGEVEPYTPVRASGAFDPEHEVLLYGRSLDGEPGHLVVTPLVFDDGTAALVIRGWVPFDHQTAPVADAEPPTGELTIDGFLVPDEGDGSMVPDEDGVIRRLDVRGVRSTLPYVVLPLAIQLTEQAPPQPSALPVPIPPEELSEGPHLSYAIQWFTFATIAVVGAVILLRRERRGPTAAP
jgi:cytochrome oxidase assembly protein ShyY1